MKIYFLLTLFLFLAFINNNPIVNTSASQTNSSDKYGGSLIDSSHADAQIFNPVISSDSASSNIESLVFEGMLTYDKDFDIVPHLAHSWDISENKLDYTFYLREDVFWHDGDQFTADDVIFTWDRILDPETDTTRVSMFELLDYNGIPYEKIDDFTVIFHLESPSPSMLNNLMFSIIPSHAYQNYLGQDGILHTADDCRDFEGAYTFNDDPINEDPTGTGCMMFKEWNKYENITLIRNSIDNGGTGYWKEHDAYLDQYTVKIISDVNKQLLAIENGEIHIMDLSSTSQDDILRLYEDPLINVYSRPTFTSDHIAFQCDPSKGDLYGQDSRDFSVDPNNFAGFEWQTAERPEIIGHLVRQALNYAIDKQNLIDNVYPQGYRNLGPMYLAQNEWYNEDVNPYDYNLTKANELLEQAGFGVTADDPRRSELNFTLSANQGSWRRPNTCTYLSEQWAELGIAVKVESIEWVSMLNSHYDNRNFDAMSAGWTGGGGDPDLTGVWSSRNIMPGGQPVEFNFDGSWIWDGIPLPGGLNYMSYWNPTVDLLMDEARTEEDQNVRKELYDQIQEIIVDDSPYIWLIAHVNMVAINANFYGFTDDSLAGIWAEPQGFRNIYYVSPESTSDTTSVGNSVDFWFFDFLFDLRIEELPFINELQIIDIGLLGLVSLELVILLKITQRIILKRF